MDVYGVSRHGDAVLKADYILRAKYLGENLGHAVLNPQVDWTGRFLGDGDEEACPGCRTSLVIARPGRDYVECAICGRRGYISVGDGGISYRWPADAQNRLTMEGKYEHIREIERHGLMRPENADELVKERLEKFISWDKCVQIPPSRQGGNKEMSE
jgi:ribosomal protein S27E